MVIYGIDDKRILNATLTEGAEHEQELGRSDFVKLSWESNTKVTIPAGAYIVPFADGLKYRLMDSYTPSETDKGFRYEPEFHHPLMLLSRIPFLYVEGDLKQQEWSFDGLTVRALEYVCKAINEAFNITDEKKKFTYTLCGNVDASVSFSVSANDILSVLSSIAQACKTNACEWHLSWEHRALYFGQVSINLGEEVPLLKVHDNIQTASVNGSKENYYNCFYPQGSTKNMSRKAIVGTGNVATLARLGLNKAKYPDGCIYIDTDGEVSTKAKFDSSKAIKQTLALSFDDIYPHIDLYAYNVRKRTRFLKNSQTNEIEQDSKGNKKTYTIWYMRLAYPSTSLVAGKTPINITSDKDEQGNTVIHYWYDYEITPKKQILQGYTLKGIFKVNTHTTDHKYDALSQSLVGQPNGQEGFELDYKEINNTIEPNAAEGDSGVSVLKGDYEIIKYQSGDTIIPTNENEGLFPRGKDKPDFTCNIVVLFNIVMGEYETKIAQEELAARTIKEINRRTQDNNNYSFASNPVEFSKSNPNLYIGQEVTFSDGQGYQLKTRVLKLVTKLDYPIIQEITVGNQAVKGTISQLKEDVNNILSGNFSGGGLNNEQVSAIVRNYTDNRFLSKLAPDTAHALITFLKGLRLGSGNLGVDENGDARLRRVDVGEFRSGVSGGTLTQTEDGSYLEVDKAYFRVKAIFDSLQIARTEYSYGDRIVGHGGVKIARVEEFASFYRCYYLAEQDGVKVHNPFVVGDQAIAKEFNVKEGTTQHAANHFLWAAVIGVGDGYVDVSKGLCAAGSDAPLAGDSLCQLGYRGTDRPERQCAIIEKTTGENVPAYVMLQGINDFSLDGKDVLSFGWDSTKERAYLRDYGESYIGDRERKQYVEYTPDGGLHVNAKKVTIVADGTETDVGDAYKNLSRRVGEIDVKAGEIDLRIRNRKVGGVNLLKGTAFDKLPERNTQNLSLGTDVSVKHYGRNYVAIDVSGATGALYRGVYLHTMTVARNIEYTASVYLRCDAPTALDEGAYLEVYTTKGADHTRQTWVTGARLTNNTAGQWKRLVVTFTTPDEDFDGLAVNIFVKQNGKVYVSEPQLEVGNVVTDWSENPDEVHDTILSIRDGAIDLTAKRFVVRSEQGAPIAIFADGKIKAEFLDATTIWAEILKAKHAKFEDLTVVGDSTFDGTVRAQSGKIGSFEIKDGSLIAEQKVTVGAGEQRVARSMALSSNWIIFDDKPYKMRIVLGGTSPAFSYNVCAMQITSNSKALLNNTGIFLDVQGGQPADYTTDDGIPTGAHALYVEHGNICGLRHQVLRVKQSVVISKMDTVIRSVATSKITVTLPADCEDGQLYIIHPSSAGIIIAAQGGDQIVYYDEMIDLTKTVHRSILTTTELDLKDRKLAGISLVYDKTNKHWLSDFIDIPSAYWSN